MIGSLIAVGSYIMYLGRNDCVVAVRPPTIPELVLPAGIEDTNLGTLNPRVVFEEATHAFNRHVLTFRSRLDRIAARDLALVPLQVCLGAPSATQKESIRIADTMARFLYLRLNISFSS